MKEGSQSEIYRSRYLRIIIIGGAGWSLVTLPRIKLIKEVSSDGALR